MSTVLNAPTRSEAENLLSWSDETHERHMWSAIAAAHFSASLGGAAIGAVIVDRSGRVIAEGHSTVGPCCDPTAHAETSAIRLAARRLGRSHMPDLALYSTLEPCSMCLAACTWANLGAVVFGADGTVAPSSYFDRRNYCAVAHAAETRRDGARTPLPIRSGVLFEETAALLRAA